MTTDQRIRYELIRAVLRGHKLKLVEIGAGSGALSRLLEEDGHTVYASDIPTQFGGLESVPRGFYADGRALPIPSEFADATVCSEVLEHIQPEGRAQLMGEIQRVTKPGGIMLMTAFVRKTFSFRLWGVAWRLAGGNLPSWYVEHMTIPTPRKDDLIANLPGELLAEHEFIGAATLAATWIEGAFHIANPPVASASLAQGLDWFSRKASYLRAVRKPRPGG